MIETGKITYLTPGAKIGFIALLGIFLCLYIFVIFPMRHEVVAASCRTKIVFATCKLYAEQHDNRYPPLSNTRGRLLYDLNYLGADHFCSAQDGLDSGYYYELVKVSTGEEQNAQEDNHVSDYIYLDDGRVMKVVNKFTDFIYLGYAIENVEQFQEFFKAYERVIESGTSFDNDLSVSLGKGTCGGDVLKRLYSIEHPSAACYADNAASIPLAIEWPGHHKRGYPLFYTTYSKVTFLDGHTEDLEYPGKFPMVPEVIEGLRKIAAHYKPIPIENNTVHIVLP